MSIDNGSVPVSTDESGTDQSRDDGAQAQPSALAANTAAINGLAAVLERLIAAIRDSIPYELIELAMDDCGDGCGEECGEDEPAQAGSTHDTAARPSTRDADDTEDAEGEAVPCERGARPALALLPQPREESDPCEPASGCCQAERVEAGRGRHAKPDRCDDDLCDTTRAAGASDRAEADPVDAEPVKAGAGR